MRAAAPWHGIDVTAHDGSAAGLYRQHHLALVEAQVSGLGSPVRGISRRGRCQ
jgi:hypothetical protein